ncbi:MAG: class I SAM-dependent methyltransferase [Oscillatoriaceae bacterium SKW80]|nr:class I SAM-dependent methyltransferase [Oscillatoriaceae bacterium SKYG93]MCX8120233.1 class I SAM-dependent methyltransferase [Oscillatoriaceae bacterium SKW80]MDW8453159.1 class I SAM-dependent methyltransferase [Oscillatoriaceae cyanobacterium SKYGB_i_bin93]HIK28929.1 class I SAM-dependent methyltransferase [Oscillatoriaceae cyanobacterium M7585_C2015_266]
MSDTLTKLAYQGFQQGKSIFGLTHKNLSSNLKKLLYPELEKQVKTLAPAVLQKLQERMERLLEVDWQDAEQGVYPTSILFDNPWEDFFLYYPVVWIDLFQIWERLKNKKYQEFSPDIETEKYPKYYLQNFHYQTNGYLSDLSANLYDLQVEILFNGTADPMRRRSLAPLINGLKIFSDTPPYQIRVLDVACGTGRTLKFIRYALPKASLFGTDMSPAYLRKANQLLSQIPGELPQLTQANAENLPYLDNYFHAVTSVFLFHELPAPVRQRVIEECFRVTKPGGVFVICDSMQMDDSPEFMPLMENFPVLFHEPFYRHYTTDNLQERLEKAGFVNITTEVYFVSKYWVAHKPLEKEG